jgi:hypothetical protein
MNAHIAREAPIAARRRISFLLAAGFAYSAPALDPEIAGRAPTRQ